MDESQPTTFIWLCVYIGIGEQHMKEIEVIEKARKGEITLPESMTDEETKMMKQNINVPFCRRWASESEARWNEKKAELIAMEKKDAETLNHKPISDEKWRETL